VKSTKHNENSNKRFYLKTDKFSDQTSLLIPQQVSIKSIHLHYPYCRREAGYISIQLSNENWMEESNTLTYNDGSVPIPFWYYAEDNHANIFPPKPTPILSEVLRKKYLLASQLELTNILYKNNTLISTSGIYQYPNCDKNCPVLQNLASIRIEYFPTGREKYEESFVPKLIFNYAMTLGPFSNVDKYTFLCCGSTDQQRISFSALFSAFDQTTTICIFVIMIVWPVTFRLFENKFDIRRFVRCYQTLMG